MAKAVAAMPASTVTTISTDHGNTTSPEAGTSGFTAVNETPSPATSTSSPEDSPRGKTNGYQSEQKRKRSDSVDGSPRRYDYSPPKRIEHQHMADRALHVLGNSGQQGYYPSNGSDRSGYAWGQDRSQGENAGSVQGQSDDQNDDQSQDNQYSPQPGVGQVTDSTGTPPVRPGGPVIQINKRKRNFSNRTKTGCMTCRSRKKKCDEGRPICNNCSRGGFQCQGYTVMRGTWPKTNGTKGPVPLQSKDGQASEYKNDGDPTSVQHSSARPGVSGEGQQHEPVQYAQAPEPRNRSSYSGLPWPPQQGHPSYTNDALPPLSELARPDSNKPDYSSQPPREMSRAPSHPVPPAPNPQSGHWNVPPQPEYRPAYPQPPPPPRIDTHQSAPPMRPPPPNPEYQKSGAKTFTFEEVERSRMLRHSRFNHFDPTLKNERQRCAEALARYNNACMLRSGVTEQEAQNMLIKVFDPSLDLTHPFITPCKDKGVLGPGVKIEAPFRCSYGYNIRIGDNVFIGENTRIDDAGHVDIGARTWIGPNVTILTAEAMRDMVDRKGTESACMCYPVTIASEVVIGSNAVIYPGVTLGRGSTVEPFAVVRESLGENQTQKCAVGPRSN